MKHLGIIIIILSINHLTYSQKIENFVFKSDSIQVKFTDTDSTKFQNYFEDQSKIDSIIKAYSNWHKRALAIEKYQIKKYNPKIIIDSIKRIVTLKNDKKIVLTPNNKREEAEYTYEKSFLNSNLLLFRVQWFEGNSYFLLNNLNGSKTYTFGKVYISPENNLLISINNDIFAGYSSNGIQIFAIDKDYRLKKLWEYEMTNWGSKNIKWISNNSLIVLGNYYDRTDNSKYKEFYKKIEINVP